MATTTRRTSVAKTPSAGYGLVDELRPAYPDARIEIVRPERVAVVTRYFLERWAPKLGANATLTLLALRRRCYANADTGEIRNTCMPRIEDLAAEVGADRKTVMRALRKLETFKFIVRQKRYRLSEQSLGVSRSTDLYTVMMFEPIAPEDEGRAAVLEAQRIAGDADPVSVEVQHESHSGTDNGEPRGELAQPAATKAAAVSTPRSAAVAGPLSVPKRDRSSGPILGPQKTVPGEALRTFERSNGVQAGNRAQARERPAPARSERPTGTPGIGVSPGAQSSGPPPRTDQPPAPAPSAKREPAAAGSPSGKSERCRPRGAPMDDPRVACLVGDVERELDDRRSRGFMIRVVTLVPEDTVRAALSETREAHREGRIRGSLGAYFAGVVKRKAEDLGVQLERRPR